MKFTFEIDDADDAANAVAMCRAICDAIALYEDPGKLREKLDQAEKARVLSRNRPRSRNPSIRPHRSRKTAAERRSR